MSTPTVVVPPTTQAQGQSNVPVATQPPASPNALTALVGRLKDYGATVFKQQKPWNEMLDRNTLSKPANLSEALGRIKKNGAYFKVNYLMIMLTTFVVSFVMHPTSLFVLGAILLAWIYLFFIRTQPLVIGGKQFSEREKVISMAAISLVTIFFLTSVGTVFFSALSIGFTVIALHGAFREPDNLFLDDSQENQPMLFGILPSVAASTTGIQAV